MRERKGCAGILTFKLYKLIIDPFSIPGLQQQSPHPRCLPLKLEMLRKLVGWFTETGKSEKARNSPQSRWDHLKQTKEELFDVKGIWVTCEKPHSAGHTTIIFHIFLILCPEYYDFLEYFKLIAGLQSSPLTVDYPRLH